METLIGWVETFLLGGDTLSGLATLQWTSQDMGLYRSDPHRGSVGMAVPLVEGQLCHEGALRRCCRWFRSGLMTEALPK